MKIFYFVFQFHAEEQKTPPKTQKKEEKALFLCLYLKIDDRQQAYLYSFLF